MPVALQKHARDEKYLRAVEQKPLSFAELFAEYAPFVWRVLRHLGTAEADLPDLSQEVFVVIHRKLKTFDGRSTVRSWIYSICIRVASGHRRRAYVRRELPTEKIPEVISAAQQQADLENRRALTYLDSLLSALSPEKRQVFLLYEIEELTMSEVADALNCPLTTAFSRLYAARNELATAIRRSRAKGRL